MNRMLARLEQAQARQRRQVSDASHELRSPVAATRQHAEVALAHPDRTTVGELAETVLAEDLRLQRLAEDLLLLTRADEHTLALRRRARSTSTTWSWPRPGGCTAPPAFGSTPPRCRPAGSRATGPPCGGWSATSPTTPPATPPGAWPSRSPNATAPCGWRSRTTAPGIPVADRERVFERFVRLDDARACDDGGSGLGLAIVAELVAAHGGTVSINAGSLGGARVEVVLPRPAGSGD
jgi:signal transduction histidine kinase